MNAPATSLPVHRVAPDPWHVLGGVWRLTFRKFLLPSHWLALGGMLAVLVIISIPAVPADATADSFARWAVRFYLMFLVPIMAFISAAGAMRDEMKGPTVDYVFTRPVRRPYFILFKYLSHVACSQLDFLLAFAVVVGVGLFRHAPNLGAVVPLLLLGQVLVVVVFSAFGFLCGVLTSRYIILGLIYGASIEVGVGQIPTQLSRLSMTHQINVMLQPLVDPARPLPHGSGPLATTALLLVVSAALLALAAAVFSQLELSGPDEA